MMVLRRVVEADGCGVVDWNRCATDVECGPVEAVPMDHRSEAWVRGGDR